MRGLAKRLELEHEHPIHAGPISNNPLLPKSDLQILLSNARQLYSSKEDLLGI